MKFREKNDENQNNASNKIRRVNLILTIRTMLTRRILKYFKFKNYRSFCEKVSYKKLTKHLSKSNEIFSPRSESTLERDFRRRSAAEIAN